MVVEDAALDPCFRDNPLVTGPPGIRFYAGAPIVSHTGTHWAPFASSIASRANWIAQAGGDWPISPSVPPPSSNCIARRFGSDSHKRLDVMAKNLDRQAIVQDEAHSLRGASLPVCATSLAQSAEQRGSPLTNRRGADQSLLKIGWRCVNQSA